MVLERQFPPTAFIRRHTSMIVEAYLNRGLPRAFIVKRLHQPDLRGDLRGELHRVLATLRDEGQRADLIAILLEA